MVMGRLLAGELIGAGYIYLDPKDSGWELFDFTLSSRRNSIYC